MYLIRARSGQTQKLTTITESTIPTVLAGPYGTSFPHQDTRHLLAVAGGSGVSFTLPVVQELLLRSPLSPAGFEKKHDSLSSSAGGVIDFIWIIRHSHDATWIAPELSALKIALAQNLGLRIKIYVTREDASDASAKSLAAPEITGAETETEEISSSSSSEDLANPEKSAYHTTTVHALSSSPQNQSHNLHSLLTPLPKYSSRFSVSFLSHAHPDLSEIVSDFRDRCAETNSASYGGAEEAGEIVGSGPEGMGHDLRLAVAAGAGVGVGERFHWDGRE
jgi:ferric-chelate reductase